MPHSWNAQDTTLNKSSVGWYRKEFTLPRSPRRANHFWKARFEGSNYRTWIWLNGKQIGTYTGYFPFEVDLEGLRRGRNTLVVKVSSLRSNRDLTHWRPAAFNGFGTGGWWNFGGLLREVYVRRIDTIDIEDVHVLPRLRRVGGPAAVEVRVRLRNLTNRDRNVGLSFSVAGDRFSFGRETVPANMERELVNRFTIARPKLWQPGRPTLYPMTVYADEGGARRRRLQAALRRAQARDAPRRRDPAERQAGQPARREHPRGRPRGGRRAVPGHPPPARLAAAQPRRHPDPLALPAPPRPSSSCSTSTGSSTGSTRRCTSCRTGCFAESGVREAAERAVVLTVRNNLNHPSVMTWALVNEPAENGNEFGSFGSGLARWIRDASAAARELDDTRLIGIDRHSRLGEPVTSSAYRHLDVLGVNEYFGWYRSVREDDTTRGPSTLEELGPFLDEIHARNPNLPLVITEFGAEASQSGAVEQEGTFEFQRKFAVDHLRVHASKRYVNGSIWWALRDFRVHPQWAGGAPDGYATPPWHNKSLIEETDSPKGVYFDMQRRWRKTRPLR